ncbi:glycosyltransferase involved in cell wall biosynthesis [Rhodococcus rhodochrous J45]|uniref:Glycosyltransferase involved in cell wall biosynthesis n=1 Tax=Rhodococcus rhodochrous J45 TaxID=935266 RepID=A0A562EN62_RHORH|nr:glycosyltransferase family 4 protein [Rhodococcus rhodochrous]TWH23074.1 glycosyltransferase involved in cell wall biosynthesis [Rhodococcus rhodochrous J45]
MTSRRALWVSTGPTMRGGIATFVRTMQNTDLWTDWNIEHISTHCDGSVVRRIGRFSIGLVSFGYRMIRRRPDVVHLHTASYGSFVRKATLAWMARGARVPVVLHIHGAEFHRFYAVCPSPLRYLVRATLTMAAAVVALGDEWARRLEAIAPGARVLVVPNAVRPCPPVSHEPDGRPVDVLFLGEIGERKGTFVLLDAWSRLVREGVVSPAVAHLTVAGNGAVAAATEQIHTTGTSDTVTIAGWTAPEKVEGLVASSRVFVLPSRNEGQPMAVLEAMAAGLCIVTSPVGGIPDLLDEHSALLVPPDEPAALTAALRCALTDAATRAGLGAAARQRVLTDFDVDVVSRRFDALYREVGSCTVPAPYE